MVFSAHMLEVMDSTASWTAFSRPLRFSPALLHAQRELFLPMCAAWGIQVLQGTEICQRSASLQGCQFLCC